MSAVFSGGLVYEYSEEGSKYGLVKIEGGQIKELDDFKALQSAYSGQSDPSGDAGYKPSGSPSQCPKPSGNWAVQDASLPNIPEPAKKYFSSGAGNGVGLGGPGSQTAGTPSTSNSTGGSSTTTGAKKKGAASSVSAPGLSMIGGFAVLVLGAIGAAL